MKTGRRQIEQERQQQQQWKQAQQRGATKVAGAAAAAAAAAGATQKVQEERERADLIVDILAMPAAMEAEIFATHPYGRDCLSDADIAAYVDKGLSGEELQKAKKHILGCTHCAYEIAFLQKALGDL